MRQAEAVKILNLSGDITQEVITKAYRAAAKKFHPDRNPAGLEMMKLINQANDVLSKDPIFTTTAENNNYDEKLNDAINAAMILEGVIIEVCGIWVWLSGETRGSKEEIKAAGFKWASKKKQWYFRPDDYKSSSRGRYSMSDIRSIHGSKIIEIEERKKLA